MTNIFKKIGTAFSRTEKRHDSMVKEMLADIDKEKKRLKVDMRISYCGQKVYGNWHIEDKCGLFEIKLREEDTCINTIKGKMYKRVWNKETKEDEYTLINEIYDGRLKLREMIEFIKDWIKGIDTITNGKEYIEFIDNLETLKLREDKEVDYIKFYNHTKYEKEILADYKRNMKTKMELPKAERYFKLNSDWDFVPKEEEHDNGKKRRNKFI